MTLFELQQSIHTNAIAKGFWESSHGKPNLPEKLALVHCEVSEAVEVLRQPDFQWEDFSEELADIVIRVLDISDALNINLAKVIEYKHKKNLKRKYMHGKRF